MRLKSIPWFVWVIPAVMLLIATARLPYGYYTFMRIVTCAAAVLIAVASWNERPAGQFWAVLFGGLAILFNPLIPIHLTRSAWFVLDIGAAAIFAAHFVIIRYIGRATEQNH
jgi:hypothetical protein